MNRVIYSCKYFKIIVKELLLVFVILVILFFGLKACQNIYIEKEKEDKIENICAFAGNNINDLNRLMSTSDLCSDQWHSDFNVFIKRIEDQNKYINRKDNDEFDLVLELQISLLNKLSDFSEEQGETNINNLEETF